MSETKQMSEEPVQAAQTFGWAQEYRAGDKVLIEDGPFEGLEGTFVEEQSSRAILSVQLARSVVLIEMDFDWIRLAPHAVAVSA